MRNSQRFEGLEEDKITWYSNTIIETSTIIRGLEEDKITWYSNFLEPKGNRERFGRV